MLRAGLVGLGMMGHHHARVLSTLPDVEFVGSCDLDQAVSRFGQGRPCFASLSELLDQGINYAVIATPTISHLDIALKLAASGVHILVEKPLAHDFHSAKRLMEEFKNRNLIGAVGQIERFNPAIREAKSRIDMLGSIYQISTKRQGPFHGRISDVGVVKDLATHDVDIVSWITSQNYESVSARTKAKDGRTNEDILVALGLLNKGTIVNHEVNWLSPCKERSISILGEHGRFEIDTLNADLTFYSFGKSKTDWDEIARLRGTSEGEVIKFSLIKKEPLLLEHEIFRDAVLGKSSDFVSLKEGANIVSVAEAMLQSSKLGKFMEPIYL